MIRKSVPASVILSTMIFLSACQIDLFSPTVSSPGSYAITPPYPNPFNTMTTIEFSLPYASDVLLVAQNPLGDVVETLVSKPLPAGWHRVVWDASKGGTRDLKAGLYFITLHAGNFTGSTVAKLEK